MDFKRITIFTSLSFIGYNSFNPTASLHMVPDGGIKRDSKNGSSGRI